MERVGSALSPHIAEARRWPAAEAVEMFAPDGKGRLGLRPEGHMHMPNARDVPWWAFVDGCVIPQQTETAYREERELTIPVLAGTNANEGSVFLQDFPVTTQAGYCRYPNSNYAPCGTEMFELYPAISPAGIKAAVDYIIREVLFLYGAHGIAQAEQGKSQQTYLGRFPRGSRDKKRASLRAWHGRRFPMSSDLRTPLLPQPISTHGRRQSRNR
jgi:carboxylesterase type B